MQKLETDENRQKRHSRENVQTGLGLVAAGVLAVAAVLSYLPNNLTNEAIETPQSINNSTETQKTRP